MIPMDVYQCPECELKFATANDLEHHIRLDHPDFVPEEIEIDEVVEAARKDRRRRGPSGG